MAWVISSLALLITICSWWLYRQNYLLYYGDAQAHLNISRSISRTAHDVIDDSQRLAAQKLRAVLATYAQAEDLIRIGAYARGSMPSIDKAIELREKVLPWLRQAKNERSPLAQTREAMNRIAAAWTF